MNHRPPSLGILALLAALPLIWPAAAAELWVAPDGADSNLGSSNAPLASLAAALEKARGWQAAASVSPSPRFAESSEQNGEGAGARITRKSSCIEPMNRHDPQICGAGFPTCGFTGLSSPVFPASELPRWLSGQNPADRNVCATGRFMERCSVDQPAAASLRIILRDGVYSLAGPIRFQSPEGPQTPGARPTNAVPVSIEAAPGEHPVLSGGLTIGNWKKLTANVRGLPAAAPGEVWVADAPKWERHVLEFRQLWLNNRKAVRAREPNDGSLARLVAWDKTNQVATIPAVTLAGIKRPSGLEMVVDQVWEIAILRVKSIRRQGTNALLTFKAPESQLEFQHPWPLVTVNAKYRAPFFLADAIEFLDEPGEWFEDVPAGKIYYWPRAGEDMARAQVVVPAIETLVRIEGTPDQPVTGLQFKGITFAHTTWLRPSQQGHVPLQDGMYLLDAEKLSPKGTLYHPGLDNVAWVGRPPGAVSIKNAESISFDNCTFEHLASAGLDFESGTHDDLVQGCTFRDIGGNGTQVGKFSDSNVETHVPYHPSDEREVCARETIANNVFSDCANEDWGCVGVGVGYGQSISVQHNDIFHLPYTAISVGWGWTKMTNAMRKNLVFANRIHEVGRQLGDLGGIYTLSAQPGTIVAENSISDIAPSPFVPDPKHWFYLYLDEGSSGITVRDNWCPAEKFLRNANGPGNVWTNNGPQVSAETKNAAGLEPAFQYLLNRAQER